MNNRIPRLIVVRVVGIGIGGFIAPGVAVLLNIDLSVVAEALNATIDVVAINERRVSKPGGGCGIASVVVVERHVANLIGRSAIAVVAVDKGEIADLICRRRIALVVVVEGEITNLIGGYGVAFVIVVEGEVTDLCRCTARAVTVVVKRYFRVGGGYVKCHNGGNQNARKADDSFHGGVLPTVLM